MEVCVCEPCFKIRGFVRLEQLCIFVNIYFRLRINPLCWEDTGAIEGQHGVWCHMWWKRVSKIPSFFALSFASLSTSSLHVIFVWARTFLMVVL